MKKQIKPMAKTLAIVAATFTLTFTSCKKQNVEPIITEAVTQTSNESNKSIKLLENYNLDFTKRLSEQNTSNLMFAQIRAWCKKVWNADVDGYKSADNYRENYDCSISDWQVVQASINSSIGAMSLNGGPKTTGNGVNGFYGINLNNAIDPIINTYNPYDSAGKLHNSSLRLALSNGSLWNNSIFNFNAFYSIQKNHFIANGVNTINYIMQGDYVTDANNSYQIINNSSNILFMATNFKNAGYFTSDDYTLMTPFIKYISANDLTLEQLTNYIVGYENNVATMTNLNPLTKKQVLSRLAIARYSSTFWATAAK